jgi:hypothetical protein
LEFIYIAKLKNEAAGPYRIGYTDSFDVRFRSPGINREDLEILSVLPLEEGYAKEVQSRMYGHLWEHTKNNVPLFHTTLEEINRNLQFVFDYFKPKEIRATSKFSKEFKNNFTFMYDFT